MFTSDSRLITPFQQSLATIVIPAVKRTWIEERYVPMLRTSYRHCRRIAILFNTNRLIITIGSIIVPALLSIQRADEPAAVSIYWITWTASLLVTICNGLMTMFKLDRKYYLFHASFEQLKTEGWQYLALAGAYAADPHNHESQFEAFARAVERLRMRETEEVYIKLQDSGGSRGTTASAGPGGIPNVVDPSRTPSRDDPLTQFINYVRQQLDGRDSQPPIGNGGRPGSQAQTTYQDPVPHTTPAAPPRNTPGQGPRSDLHRPAQSVSV